MGHHCPTPRGLPLPLRRVLKIYFCPANERQDVNVGGDGGVFFRAFESVYKKGTNESQRIDGWTIIYFTPRGSQTSTNGNNASPLGCLFFVSLDHACITGCCEEDMTLSLLFPLSFPASWVSASLLSTCCLTLFSYSLLIAIFALPILL